MIPSAFSAEDSELDQTPMNEEMTQAIAILCKYRTDKPWFIPVKLSECEIPDRDSGPGETLQDLQPVELYKDWDAGIQRLLAVIQPAITRQTDASAEAITSPVQGATWSERGGVSPVGAIDLRSEISLRSTCPLAFRSQKRA